MDYKVLYRKYRPDSFENIIGQEFIITTLKNSIVNQKIAHAYIFTGPKGTGKTSTAKVFAKIVNCLNSNEAIACGKCFNCTMNENPDVIEIDAASNNGVDEIRELRTNVKISPSNSKYKIYIIDEVHMLSTEAFNALLKTLEEPPSHVIFILATTDIQKVPMTILSRCQRFDFKKISNIDMSKRIKEICKLEKIKIEESALDEITLIADGSFRDTLSILDQLNNGNKITINEVGRISGSVSNKHLNDLLLAIKEKNVQTVNKIIHEISDIGVNYKFFIDKFILVLRDYAVDLKPNNFKLEIEYKKLKKMIFELVDSLNITKNISNPFLIAELIILDNIYLDNFTENSENVDKEIISREIINDKKVKEKEEKITVDEKKETDSELNQQFIEVRINNCFVSASKDCLNLIKNKWQDFVDNIKFNDQELSSLLIDTSVVAASDKYAIIEVENSSQSNLLNKELSTIEKQFFVDNNNYRLIFLTKKEWEKEKKEYIKNKKNKYEYNLKDEIIVKKKKRKSKMESVAFEIFDSAKIEIK